MNRQVSVIFMIAGVLFTVCLLVSNIVEQKTISFLGTTSTAGLIIFPLSYILNDVIAEVWGYKKARLIIWLGFIMNFLTVLIFKASILLPSSEHFTNQAAFESVLGSTGRIVVASFLAFLIGSFVNAYVMSRMKVLTKGKGFSIRAVVSTILGESCDSIVFFSIAFYMFDLNTIIILILTQTAMKTGYEILALPLTTRIVKWVKKVDKTDIYDKNISYNPLKIGQL